MRQFALFGIAGVLGFAVDACVVLALVSGLGLNPYFSRLLSFLCAATATWLFNRRYTFTKKVKSSKRKEWPKYLLAMSGGFCLNYGTYALIVALLGVADKKHLLFAVAAGSGAGAIVNYFMSKYWVFRAVPASSPPAPPG